MQASNKRGRGKTAAGTAVLGAVRETEQHSITTPIIAHFATIRKNIGSVSVIFHADNPNPDVIINASTETEQQALAPLRDQVHRWLATFAAREQATC